MREQNRTFPTPSPGAAIVGVVANGNSSFRSCGQPRINRFCKTYRRPGFFGWLLGIGALSFYLMAGKRGVLAHPMTCFFVNGQNVPARLET